MKTFILAALMAVALPAGSAQLYRWVDADGRVFYTDKPPPGEARDTHKMRVNTRADEIPPPYQMREAVKNFPVTLFTGECGEPCESAKEFLLARGVPFTEKDGREASVQEELRKLVGSIDVPVLLVGRIPVRGWEAGLWTTNLDAAGYPRANTKRPSPAAVKKGGDKAAAPEPVAGGEPSPGKAADARPAAGAPADSRTDRAAGR